MLQLTRLEKALVLEGRVGADGIPQSLLFGDVVAELEVLGLDVLNLARVAPREDLVQPLLIRADARQGIIQHFRVHPRLALDQRHAAVLEVPAELVVERLKQGDSLVLLEHLRDGHDLRRGACDRQRAASGCR